MGLDRKDNNQPERFSTFFVRTEVPSEDFCNDRNQPEEQERESLDLSIEDMEKELMKFFELRDIITYLETIDLVVRLKDRADGWDYTSIDCEYIDSNYRIQEKQFTVEDYHFLKLLIENNKVNPYA